MTDRVTREQLKRLWDLERAVLEELTDIPSRLEQRGIEDQATSDIAIELAPSVAKGLARSETSFAARFTAAISVGVSTGLLLGMRIAEERAQERERA
jgi:hypothetical protein